jgi:hypothetical protein
VFIQVLVSEQVATGKRIVEALRKDRFPISGAFWYRMPESGFWRLFIGSKLVDRIGPLEGYKRLQSILTEMGVLTPFSGSIALLGADDPQFLRLKSYALGLGNIGPSLGQDANPFQDAYVYRLKNVA